MAMVQTSKAIYIIVRDPATCTNIFLLTREIQSYDYALDKVKMFTRVPLGDIVGIQKGTGSSG